MRYKNFKNNQSIFFLFNLILQSSGLSFASSDSIQFDQPTTIYEVSKAQCVQIADMNNDGRNDVILGVNAPGFSDNPYLRIFYQSDQGEILVPTYHDTLLYAQDMDAVDLNKDGLTDLVVADHLGKGVRLYFQGPLGSLEERPMKNPLVGCLSTSIADFNNDNLLDIIVIRPTVGGPKDSFYVCYQQINGSFDSVGIYPLDKTMYTWPVVRSGDFNGDGLQDAVIVGGDLEKNISIFTQEADGKMKLSQHIPFPNFLWNISVGDFTQDNRDDFVVAYPFSDTAESYIALFAQGSDGKFPETPIYYPAFQGPTNVFSGDIDMDGKTDIFVMHMNQYIFTIYRQKEGGGFEPFKYYAYANRDANFQASVAIGDINNDQKPDVVSVSILGDLVLMLNTTNKSNPSYVNEFNINQPAEFVLNQNFPNPFNGATTISYGIPEQAIVKVKIFDLLGREVGNLLEQEQSAGFHTIRWQTNTSSGVYFCRFEAQSIENSSQIYVLIKKMQLIR